MLFRSADVVARNGPEHDNTNNSADQGTSLRAGLKSNVHTHSEKAIRTIPSKSAVVSAYIYTRGIRKFEAGGTAAHHDLKIGEYPSAEGVVSNPKPSDVDGMGFGSVQRKAARTEEKRVDDTIVASCSTRISQKPGSASVHNDLVMRGRSSGTSENVFPMGFKSSTTQR